jgi:drug/metabolite transporter (DMT)-like permease
MAPIIFSPTLQLFPSFPHVAQSHSSIHHHGSLTHSHSLTHSLTYSIHHPCCDYITKTMHVPGEASLLNALLIFSSQNSVFKLLNNSNEDIFSPCNILCAASTYGFIFMFSYYVGYSRSVTLKSFHEIVYFDGIMLLIGSFLYSVAGPFLFLMGLQSVSVPQAAIIQRMESINFLILSVLLLGSKNSVGTCVSACFTVLGVTVSLLWKVFFGDVLSIPLGVVYILASGYCYSASLFISKKYLAKLNSGIVNLTRVVLGTVLFHLLSLIMGNKDSLYSSRLWVLMLPYGFVYVCLGQVFWIHAVKKVSPIIIAVSTNFLFILIILFSALLLREFPNIGQWAAICFILVGIAVSMLEEIQKFSEGKNDGLMTEHVKQSREDDENSSYYLFQSDDDD